MKLKSKLVVAASALLVLSGAAAGTGAYAWYSANRVTTLGISNIGAQSGSASLETELVPGVGNVEEATAKGTHDTITDSVTMTFTWKKTTPVEGSDPVISHEPNYLTDVSGCGDAVASYQKLVPGTTGYYGTEATYQGLVGNEHAYYDMTFALKCTLSSGNAETKMALFLSPQSYIKDFNTSAHVKVAESVRFSVLYGTTAPTGRAATASGLNQMLVANPNAAFTTSKENLYLDTSHAEKDVTTIEGVKAFDNTFFANGANDYLAGALEQTKTTADNYYQKKGWLGDVTLAANGSTEVYVVFHVWIEGLDPQTVVDSATGDMQYKAQFNSLFKLYALDKAFMTDTKA